MGTSYEGTRAQRRALDGYIKLMRAAHSLDGYLESRLSAQRLTLSQLGILEALLHLGPMVQKELASKHLMSPGNITHVVGNLVRRELVERRPLESDRRCVEIHLTRRGRALIEKVLPEHVERIRARFAVLTAPEQAQLAALCKKLGLATAEAARGET